MNNNHQLPAALQPFANDSVWSLKSDDSFLGSVYSDVYKDRNGIRPRFEISVQDAYNWLQEDRLYWESPEGLEEAAKAKAEEIIWEAQLCFNGWFHYAEEGTKVTTAQIVSLAGYVSPAVEAEIDKLVEANNAAIDQVTFKAPATFSLGALLGNIQIA